MHKWIGGTAFITLMAGAGISNALDDPHMAVIARTSDEIARIAAITKPTDDFTAPERFEAKSAGAATVRARTDANAFSDSSANIGFARELDFKVGNGLFRKLWVSSPSSTLASDGLGPLYNARSCQRCHLKDGRGHPPEGPEDDATSMLVRLSVPAPGNATTDQIQDYLNTRPDPVYGGQVQDFAIPGHAAEAKVSLTWDETELPLSDGEVAHLRAPTLNLENLGYGPMDPEVMTSVRVAPQMIGLGLLDAIPAADILALADPDDADNDGISGRPNIVLSRLHGEPMLGRFGLKAGEPSVLEQSASAFGGDIGISTTIHRDGAGDCTDAQTACRAAPNGNTDIHDDAEIGNDALDLVAFYASNLGVPARRDVDDPQVLHGKRMFYDTGCIACHTPKFVTNRLEGDAAQSFQLIWPYTDLLLHDMGDGLADNRPEARAGGREWRTPPLWGIGLTQQVSGHTYFLHDGRARSLLEAILWHGGEAEIAKQRVVDMPKDDRNALIRFLESL